MPGGSNTMRDNQERDRQSSGERGSRGSGSGSDSGRSKSGYSKSAKRGGMKATAGANSTDPEAKKVVDEVIQNFKDIHDKF